MGSRGKLLLDLNEPPVVDDEETDNVICLQPQKALPSVNPNTSNMFSASVGPEGIKNNKAFSHASSMSGFQPFVRPRGTSEQKIAGDHQKSNLSSPAKSINGDNAKTAAAPLVSGLGNPGAEEREEGEWSDVEGSMDAPASSSLHELAKASKLHGRPRSAECSASGMAADNISGSTKITDNIQVESSGHPQVLDLRLIDQKSDSNRNSNSNANANGDASMENREENALIPKAREIKGVEANHAIKIANNPGKRKIDQHKETMFGKKRRQTMLINIDEVKQAGPIKSSTPRRPPTTVRTVKEVRTVTTPVEHGEKNVNLVVKDQKQVECSLNEAGASSDSCQPKSECNGDISSGQPSRLRRMNSDADFTADGQLPPVPRQSSWKQPTDSRMPKNSQFSGRKQALTSQSSVDSKLGNKKLPPAKKPASTSAQYQDTSVERLIREVTNEKFWHHPEESELQCVPGRFESVEEYVRVFEPLLFEECRAQLYSTWEELAETNIHVMVRVKNIERRERGWYDVIVLPVSEYKWTFKEGDVAVISTPRPGTVRPKRTNDENGDADTSERVAGTVRRHISLDTRDPPGAVLHIYVGDLYDSYSKADEDHILRKLQPRSTWFLTVLGSLATTQREYVALHAFCRLNSQMQTAILKPSSDHFPKYEQQTPAMPECFTQNFVDHLHRSFNGPQLAAIQWAAMHTAAGTTSGLTKKQDPWPFTLVQGPPGTGKTHTVWGMLNVIHLVQYQHYYNSLLKKLAPQSYKQANETNSDNIVLGSIDEVLHNMDKNLFRSLSKLCPKPRMLVCAPSNAATDELLARVLDRGFIDGEMKVYRPDVARVGVDSQSRAAQAVSVERRTDQLLMKSREEVSKWMQELRAQEAYYSGHIADLQNRLSMAAVDNRSQGSVGVDPDILIARDQNRDVLLQSLAASVESRDKILLEISRLLILEARYRGGTSFNMDEARNSLEASFANEAEIVFTTVSSSGRKLFSRLTHGFDMVVIDEAAQASEVGVLPPLALGAPRCVLVGDPQQLPATVISKAAGTLMYSRSLFERFQLAGCPTMLLSVQYRMHPQIRDFPSRYFYQGRLVDSESVVNLPDEQYYKDPLLKPYLFYDVTYGRESHRGGSVSYQNTYEAHLCLQLYEHLQKTVKSLGLGRITVGIITPYKLQLKCLQQEFSVVLKSEEGKGIYINTVDAFQGQERDVIIMSCVRASNHGVGFVADIRRMNVALTRARRALWVMGNANSLVRSDDWAALIADAKARNCYMDMDSLPKDFIGQKGIHSKGPSNPRGSRLGGPRHRSMESRSGTPSEEDDNTGGGPTEVGPAISRNGGGYRSFYNKPPMDRLDDVDQSVEKPRDTWQYGPHKRQNSSNNFGRREL